MTARGLTLALALLATGDALATPRPPRLQASPAACRPVRAVWILVLPLALLLRLSRRRGRPAARPR